MIRDTARSTKGSAIVRAMVAAVLVASMFGLSVLTTAAQETPSGIDPGAFEVPDPGALCQEQFPDGIVDTGTILEDALADSGLPQEVIDEIVANFSFAVTCDDLFGGGM